MSLSAFSGLPGPRPFGVVVGVAPVSIVLIVFATSSTWPNSSAAMFATRS